MSSEIAAPSAKKAVSIWWFAFGYFAVYIPYSFLTKVLTKGMASIPEGLTGADLEAAQKAVTVNSFEILPPTIMASIIVMICFISIMGWWKYATQWKLGSLSLPRPRLLTLFSGICTGIVVVTTTLAYTINGVTIVTAMLFMRGGMLIMSPIVDTIFKRKVKWFCWAALGMSMLALVISSLWNPIMNGTFDIGSIFGQPALFWVDLAAYLGAYFVRLTMMSKLAKSDNDDDTKKFFVEEQMTGTPSILIILFIIALFGAGQPYESFPGGVHAGYFDFWSNHPGKIIAYAMMIGFFSQFNGVFGGLILLDKSDNAFAVPVNRCSSILAGVGATLALVAVFPSYSMPDAGQFIGAACVVGAICFLTIPKVVAKLAAKKAALTADAVVADNNAVEAAAPAEEVKADAEEVKADEAKADEAKADEAKAE